MFTLSEEQKNWIIRRDFFYCNFIHSQSGPHEYFCRSSYLTVYGIEYIPISQRILWPWIKLQNQFISLCSHHYALMNSNHSRFSWQVRLYKVACINTLHYETHAPEDVFPI